MDVNEQIVKEYFELVKGCLVRNNIEYGKHHASIDLLAVDKQGNIFDMEVKWKSAIAIKDSKDRENGFNHFVKQLNDTERDKIIEKLIGKKPTQKMFITTKHFLSKRKFHYWKGRFEKENIEVLFFDDIIPNLVNAIHVKGKYESPVLQTIRMLKYFGIVK